MELHFYNGVLEIQGWEAWQRDHEATTGGAKCGSTPKRSVSREQLEVTIQRWAFNGSSSLGHGADQL